jgi:hypothetical protein
MSLPGLDMSVGYEGLSREGNHFRSLSLLESRQLGSSGTADVLGPHARQYAG